MAIQALSHFNLRPLDLERTKDFYVDAMGLVVGERPPFGFPGYWLYADGVPLLHLLGPRPHEKGIEPFECDDARKTGYLDHIALAARDLAAHKARLESCGVAFRENVVPSLRQTQLVFFDPNGLRIELIFDSSETGAD